MAKATCNKPLGQKISSTTCMLSSTRQHIAHVIQSSSRLTSHAYHLHQIQTSSVNYAPLEIDWLELHLMEQYGEHMPNYPEPGNNMVEKVEYTQSTDNPDQGRVWINKTQYFDGVPPEVWEFHVGGYQVCHKWLKDRKGRQLDMNDVVHYERIVGALAETITLMEQIDEVIEEHGGWPIE